MEKKNTGLKVLVIVLSLLVVALSGYIVYDKVLSKDINSNSDKNSKDDVINSNSDKNSKDDVINNQIENNITWYDYLTNQEFVSASLKICSIDGKNVHEKDVEFQPNPGVSRNITEEELKNILNTLYKSESNNERYPEVVKTGGYPEPACVDTIVYKYIRDGKEYEFILTDATSIVTEDEEFIKILDNNINSYQYYALNKNNDKYDDLTEDMMREYVSYY